MTQPLPLVAITMGDPAGIGAEIIVKALTRADVELHCRPLVVGDAGRLRFAARIVGQDVEIRTIDDVAQTSAVPDAIHCIDLSLVAPDMPWGEVSATAGEAAYRYLATSAKLAIDGRVDAICTAPLNKEAMQVAGYVFPGQTDALAQLTGTPEVSMMLVAPTLRVIHVTTHVGILDAIARIDAPLVQRTIERGVAALRQSGLERPRVGVCGINPHAGENGLFGNGEEATKIVPAIEALTARGWDIEGPLPADTLFYLAHRGDFDLVVAMYHDQGHAPIKVLGLDEAVNVSVGLPVIRTSVDHGTAFDIAGTGKASEGSLVAALRLATTMAARSEMAEA